MNPSVAIVIVNFNGSSYVSEAIESAMSQDYDGRLEVIVVDNASTDDSVAILRAEPRIHLIENLTNEGFGAGVNSALSLLETDYIALLNPDARAERSWLEKLIPWMQRGNVDLASTVIRAGADVWFAGGRFFESIGATLVRRQPTGQTDWLSGCALVATRASLLSLQGFDERFFLYYEDVDLTLRARAAGFRLGILYEPLVDHPHDGQSTNSLGRKKAEVGYYARGRLIGKHVRGWRRIPALLFAASGSPILNGVPLSSLLPVARSVFRGFWGGLADRSVPTRHPRRQSIGVLLNIYERKSGLRAGGHRHFIEVVRRWEDTEVVLFGPSSARASILAELPHSHFVSLPSLESFGAGKASDFLFRSFAWIAAIGKLRDCDVMLATSHFLPDVIPSVLSGRPTVVIIHHLIGANGSVIRANAIPRLSEEAALLFVRFGARAILVSSNLVAAELRARSFSTPIRVTTSGVDHVRLPNKIERSSDPPKALFIGRLHPAKGALDAVKAWRRVLEAEPDAILTLIGAREVETYAQEIDQFIESEQIARNIRLLGSASEEQKLASIASARLFLFPSYEEGWGIALAEAMRSGLPCVTYALPIFAEIFPRGRLEAPIGDTAALAERVVSIIQDENLRLRLSEEASSLATKFTWDKAAAIEAEVVGTFLVR